MTPAISHSVGKVSSSKKSTWLHKILEDDWMNRLIEWILRSIILIVLAVLSKLLNWIEYYRIPWFKISLMILLSLWVVKEQHHIEHAWNTLMGSRNLSTELTATASLHQHKLSENQGITVAENELPVYSVKEFTPVVHRENSPSDQQALEYIERFAKVAKAEQLKYNIPASIKLAQGILESNSGQSNLAIRNNNHFGIKCMSRSCTKGHCTNHSDDHHKDFFRKYDSAWQSWRAHSELLMADRYIHLQNLEQRNYSSWANGLQKAGYATDKNYAKKLIDIIERHQLWQFDLPVDEPI